MEKDDIYEKYDIHDIMDALNRSPRYGCPECGSMNTRTRLVRNEYSDIDGNRGIDVTYFECLDCDYEE